MVPGQLPPPLLSRHPPAAHLARRPLPVNFPRAPSTPGHFWRAHPGHFSRALKFLLIFGLATWAAAGAFARRPTPRRLRLVLGLGATTLFSVAIGIFTDLAAVGHHAAAYRTQHPDLGWPEILLQGFAEAMSPGVLGFSMLTIAALLVTWGWFREGEG